MKTAKSVRGGAYPRSPSSGSLGALLSSSPPPPPPPRSEPEELAPGRPPRRARPVAAPPGGPPGGIWNRLGACSARRSRGAAPCAAQPASSSLCGRPCSRGLARRRVGVLLALECCRRRGCMLLMFQGTRAGHELGQMHKTEELLLAFVRWCRACRWRVPQGPMRRLRSAGRPARRHGTARGSRFRVKGPPYPTLMRARPAVVICDVGDVGHTRRGGRAAGAAVPAGERCAGRKNGRAGAARQPDVPAHSPNAVPHDLQAGQRACGRRIPARSRRRGLDSREDCMRQRKAVHSARVKAEGTAHTCTRLERAGVRTGSVCDCHAGRRRRRAPEVRRGRLLRRVGDPPGAARACAGRRERAVAAADWREAKALPPTAARRTRSALDAAYSGHVP